MDQLKVPPRRRLSLDRNIERLREQLAELIPFLGKGKAQPTRSLEEFDLETERLVGEILGETSELLEAYEYAELGEASGLVNMLDEGPESSSSDDLRKSLFQRYRVLESCIAQLETRRASEAKVPKGSLQALIGPQVAEHMSPDLRCIEHNATLKDAGQRMQEWKTGSLLVIDNHSYVGIITDSALARDVVAQGLDSNKTAVQTCMRKGLVCIEGDRPIIDAVRLMKQEATRHLVVTQEGEVIGVISVSNILRYYSGVA